MSCVRADAHPRAADVRVPAGASREGRRGPRTVVDRRGQLSTAGVIPPCVVHMRYVFHHLWLHPCISPSWLACPEVVVLGHSPPAPMGATPPMDGARLGAAVTALATERTRSLYTAAVGGRYGQHHGAGSKP